MSKLRNCHNGKNEISLKENARRFRNQKADARMDSLMAYLYIDTSRFSWGDDDDDIKALVHN